MLRTYLPLFRSIGICVLATVLAGLASCGGNGSSTPTTANETQVAFSVPRHPRFAWKVADLGAGGNSTYINGMNDDGDVIVSRDGRAFLYKDGKAVDLGTLGGGNSSATAINNKGQIVGWSNAASGHVKAFLYEKGTLSEIYLGPNILTAIPQDINDHGDIVGFYQVEGASSSVHHPFIMSQGTVSELTEFTGRYVISMGINNAGQIYLAFGPTHTQTFLYEKGNAVDIGSLPVPMGSSQEMDAYDINNQGEIVGTSWFRDGFVYRNSALVDLCADVAADKCVAYGINDKSQIVGYMTTADGQHAFLYDNGNWIDLNSLPGVKESGWILSSANQINTSGRIAGKGIFNGQERVFLLTPPQAGRRPFNSL